LYKRRWARGLFVLFLVLGLVIPLSRTLRKGGSEELRSLHSPSDRTWLSGHLHTAHATLGARCETCHQPLFVQVRSEACLTCHSTNLQTHASSVAIERVSAGVSRSRLECTSYRARHEEPQRLVQTDQRLCATRHSGDVSPGPRVPRATDFRLDKLHLAAHGVEGSNGNVVMKCVDFHEAKASGHRWIATGFCGRARSRAETVGRDLFETRVCFEFHVVQRTSTNTNDGGWSVGKVSRTDAWMSA